MQVALYPSINLNITQNPYGSYSHAGTKNWDQSVHATPQLYAPVDMKLVTKGADGLCIYHTVEEVITPLGMTHFSLWMHHDNNAHMWQLNKVYRQGEHFYTEGTAGNVTGSHVHMNVALGHQFSLIQVNGNGTLPNSVHGDEIFFVNYTNIINANASGTQQYYFNWLEYEDGYTQPPFKPQGDDLHHLILANAFPFNFKNGGINENNIRY